MQVEPSAETASEARSSARSRLLARYRDAAFANSVAAPQWNAVLDTMLAHRSVRAYRKTPLPPGSLEAIVAAAQSAPPSSNLQAWSVVAVQDPARKARLSQLAAGQRHVAEAPLLLVFLADLARLGQIACERGQNAEGINYLEAFVVAVADAALAAQNALIAAESLGLGGCYIGALRNHPQEVAEELALPDAVFAAFGLTIGYPDPTVATSVKPRLPQAVVLHHEQYQRAASSAMANYDGCLRSFWAEQKMSDIDWTEHVAACVQNREALMGRDALRAILQARGFGLR